MFTYPVLVEPDDNGTLLVTFPDFPEAHTFGDDADEALVRAQDALATIIDAYIRDRQAIPEPSIQPGAYRVRLPALMAAKVELYNSMRAAHVTKTDLARRLNWHLPQVDRLLDVHHASRLDQLEAAFSVLGKEVYVTVFEHRPSRPDRGGTRSGAAAGLGTVVQRRKTASVRKPKRRASRRR